MLRVPCDTLPFPATLLESPVKEVSETIHNELATTSNKKVKKYHPRKKSVAVKFQQPRLREFQTNHKHPNILYHSHSNPTHVTEQKPINSDCYKHSLQEILMRFKCKSFIILVKKGTDKITKLSSLSFSLLRTS